MADRWRGRVLALSASAVAAVALLAGPGLVAPAAAAGAVGSTEVEHGVAALDAEFGPNPCTGDPLTGTQDGSVVQHVTVRGENVSSTFAEEAWVDVTDAAPDGSQTAYTGHFEVHGGFVLDQAHQINSLTFSGDLAGSDGTTITGHEVTHFVLEPDGTVAVSFDKMSLACGSAAS